MKKINLLIFANIITLSIFLGGCSQVSVNQRDVASSDSYDMKISDCKLPASSLKNNMEIKVSRTEFPRKEEMANRLKLIVNCINNEVAPAIDTPQKLFLNLFYDVLKPTDEKRTWQPSFLPASSDDIIKGNKYSVINMPFIFIKSPHTDKMDASAILTAHEYGHYLFSLNTVKRSTEMKAAEDKLDKAARENFKLLTLKAIKFRLYSYMQHLYDEHSLSKCNGVGRMYIVDIEDKNFWNCLQANLPEQYKVLHEKKLKLDTEYAKYKNIDSEALYEELRVFIAQSELFADLVAVLHFENPSILTFLKRDYSQRDYSLSNFKDLNVYEYYGIIRSDIWSLYKESKLSKGEFLKRVLDAMIINYKKASKHSSDKTMNNVSLLKDIAKEVYLH